MNSDKATCSTNGINKICKKDICCFHCKGRCVCESERCFSQKEYRNRVLRGYPEVCKFYVKLRN